MQGTFNYSVFNQSVFNSGDIVIYLLPGGGIGIGKVLSVTHANYSLDLPAGAIIGAPIVGNVTGIVRIVLTCGAIVGTPNVLQLTKVLSHQISQGQYIAQPIKTNRVYVVGSDVYGNLVFGDAINSNDITEYGEVLKVVTETAIPTTANADTVAANILASARLGVNRGEMVILPNCGMEVGDVIQVTDAVANQSAQKYRVMGFDFVYDPTQPTTKFTHNIKLTSV